MERQELYATLLSKEQRQNLEIQLKSEGFLDCLEFLELVEYLDPEKRKSEVGLWESSMRNSYGSEMVELAARGIAKQYDAAYLEALKLAEEYKRIGVVKRISKYLESDHKGFTTWLKERA